MSLIAIVGIGLDGVEGLTPATLKVVNQSEVLVGSRRHLNYFPQHLAEKIVITDFQQDLASIQTHLNSGKRIVVLASGDPLFFGLGRLLIARFPQADFYFYPHFSSMQLAFNRLQIPWQDAESISVHGRNNDELIKSLKQGKEKIAILTDSHNHPGAIARLYLALDLPLSYSVYVCENLGGENEQIREFSGENMTQLANLSAKDFSALNVVILLRQEQLSELALNRLPLLGLPDSSFFSFGDRPSLMTKKEVRLAILGELALQSGQTVWDIGAGTGAVAIEIARLCPNSQVWAIEKTSMGIALITKNIQRFQVKNIQPVYGTAPQVLVSLPQSDRIFIGGSGGNLNEILDFCATKLTSEGLIVMALATIEHCHLALDWLKENTWDYHLLQLQISRSTPLNHLTRFTPLNPVTIITASKKKLPDR